MRAYPFEIGTGKGRASTVADDAFGCVSVDFVDSHAAIKREAAVSLPAHPMSTAPVQGAVEYKEPQSTIPDTILCELNMVGRNLERLVEL